MKSYCDYMNAFTKAVEAKDDAAIKLAIAEIDRDQSEYFGDLLSDYGLDELIEEQRKRLGL